VPDHEDGFDVMGIRRRNLSRLLRMLHVSGGCSRSELSLRLGVNRSTVASLVGDLCARGLARERYAPATGLAGRPSPIVEPLQTGPAVLAVEITTDSIATAIVAIGGTTIGASRVDRSRDSRSAQRTLSDVADLARPLLSSIAPERLLAVGISVPGTVRHEDGFVHASPNLFWRDVPLAVLFGGLLDLSVPVPVFVGNDADLAALAEYTRGAGVGATDFICVWGEAGIGAGIITGGRPLAGFSGYAGEVGHICINPSGLVCRCGAIGCWETEVGEGALLRSAGIRPGDGGRQATADFFAAAERGASSALAATVSIGCWLGIGIAGLVNAFDPSRVVFGGLYGRLLPYVRPQIQHEIDARVIAPQRATVELVLASLGADSSLLGAAELALAPALDDPTSVTERRDIPATGPRERGVFADLEGGEEEDQKGGELSVPNGGYVLDSIRNSNV
jgi:predicted NBD/HSP70 family sugar kinase